MHTAEVVIIGGGIVGSSIAWHLTDAGCKNVLVIERESSQGKGSTGKSMGGVRAQFSTPVNIQMSLYSIPFYARFEEVVGHPADYRPQGYLFLATKESHLATCAIILRAKRSSVSPRRGCSLSKKSAPCCRNFAPMTFWAAASARPMVLSILTA